jgi:spore photoproduct lyase
MNGYLNYEPLLVQADTDSVVRAIRDAAQSVSNSLLRVSSGEVGDSLLLDPVFRLNEEIIRGVAGLPNVLYEVKTKTEYVDHLLSLPGRDHVVVAFSLNPDHVVESDEGVSASVGERIAAARRCADAGYHVAFHFDPVFLTEPFPDDYLDVIDRLSSVPRDAVIWVSMGTIRFPSSLRGRIPDRWFLAEEFVPSRDGKLRYLQPVRSRIYSTLRSALSEGLGAPVYLCMESPAMWYLVYGSGPQNLASLRGIFTRSPGTELPGLPGWRSL